MGGPALELTRRHPDLTLRAIIAFNWYFLHVELGDFRSAASVVDEMRALVASRHVSPLVVLNASMTVVLHDFLSALPSFRETVSDMLALIRAAGIADVAKYPVLCFGLFAALSDGDLTTAADWLRELDADLDGLGPGYQSWRHMCRVRSALLRGEIDVVATYQPELLRCAMAAGAPFNDAVALLISAEALGRTGHSEDAQVYVERALKIATAMRSPFVEFMCRLTRAHLCFDSGQPREGVESLRIGLALGRTGGYLNSFIWQPPVMARLCARALEAGIEVEYVRELIRKRHLTPDSPPTDIVEWPWPIKVSTLGAFDVLVNDRPLTFERKAQRKPLALLKAIVAHGGRSVREKVLMDVLWPNADGDTARFALTMAIHRLRRLLGGDEVIVRQEGAVSLNGRSCWVDVWAVERLLERADPAIAAGPKTDSLWEDGLRRVDRAAALYRGPFLDGDTDTLPTIVPDRLRRHLLRQLVDVGAHYETAGERARAAHWYETALRVDPSAEDICRRLMQNYHDCGRRSDVRSVYMACREALASRLGVGPSPETDALFKRLQH